MRIVVKLAIEVDSDAWASEYHLSDRNGNYRARDIVSDIREYVQNSVCAMVSRTDENATVTVVK